MKLLDLFCGAGLASWGYWRSGRFSEVVGVDINPMPYPFQFMQLDAYHLNYDFLLQFDFIHASPPCQFYSKATPNREKHFRSIPPIKHMLFATGLPHVIENVEGSGHDLKPNVALTGYNVGLPHRRKRYFYCSYLSIESASHIDNYQLISSANTSHKDTIVVNGGNVTKSRMLDAFGLHDLPKRYIEKITTRHIEQGIPPAMTTLLASVFPKLLIG